MKLKFSTWLLSWAVIIKSVLAVAPNNVNNTNINCYMSYNIRTGRNSRPPSEPVVPLREDRVHYGNAPQARHHIIPYATLRLFFNRLINSPTHFRHLLHNVLIVSGENVGLQLSLSTMAASLVSQYPLGELSEALRNYAYGLFDDNIMRAQQVYIWLPFNIFVGPQFRSDDPGSNFEENAQVITGQLHLAQLRRLNADINNYLQGITNDPTGIINTMADLVRITPLHYAFDPNQWRIHTNTNRFAIATPAVRADPNYREIQNTDYCAETAEDAFHRYSPEEFDLIRHYRSRRHRSRRNTRTMKICIIKDEGAKYDRFCINSVNILRALVKNNVMSIDDNGLHVTVTSAPPQSNVPISGKKNCGKHSTELGVVGGAVVGGLSALGACLIMGGAYIPLLGWTGCAIGSAFYGIGGAAAGSAVKAIAC